MLHINTNKEDKMLFASIAKRLGIAVYSDREIEDDPEIMQLAQERINDRLATSAKEAEIKKLMKAAENA